ncbi:MULTISPECIES: LytR C-terminal domain-containing protein [Streptomycetaceae]|uniref:LytR/CpsA/Psr regulator C-terminal domain-containing protein n=1 Tax=Streptantibioticus cattleyicolor (strain ATCC 35852 / DSM 46488 / JCM 4925 / NBRC 14057 / NRRL 8057) TaxID=1003195 RepID=F8K1Q3_STREN|nr:MULTISPECIES: LytR C-terminal domain-containing protein [Streptomycetaceae]AEW95324.1 hypothetical protein SCATT_29530 [Streptantibioticus cattleyicolor NRRL 8057 = DSM 46488]MYS59902.1 LytR family transcriptional regulator [Streptomyces sp. SID5468]CCB75666.1 conserved exported protein of unknown function [Streptantibioticus cattleyicolor NRRL 8057 = DSM 46488]
MSMLTPPGMGGKYRITGNQYPRMRRPRGHRRLIFAAVAAVAVVGLIGWGTVQLIDVFAGKGQQTRISAGKAPGCAGTAGTARRPAGGAPAGLPKPGSVTVNVYNATQHGGLAKTTADELKKRGFAIGKVGNAPAEYDKKVSGAAILLGGPKAQGALKVLATQVSAAQTRTDAGRGGGADVDLIIGDKFSALDAKETADRALAALTHPASASPSAGHC